MYPDDMASLCAGNTIEIVKRRARQAAAALVRRANTSKMIVTSEKTQVLVLSQAPKDATNCTVRVAGEVLSAGKRSFRRVLSDPPETPGSHPRSHAALRGPLQESATEDAHPASPSSRS